MHSINEPNIPLAHSPEAAGKRLSTPTRSIYYLMASGELVSFKIGKRRLIPETEIQRLIERKMAEAA